MNQVVVVNEKDEIIGTMPREEAHKNGTLHRIAVVYVENEKGEILVQIRMSNRLDHSAAGHVDPGESYLQTAQRELKEELGIENTELISIGKGTSHDVQPDKGINIFHAFEVFKCSAKPGLLQKEEVKSTYWDNLLNVLKQMKDDKNDDKFTGGFKASLKIYLENKKKI